MNLTARIVCLRVWGSHQHLPACAPAPLTQGLQGPTSANGTDALRLQGSWESPGAGGGYPHS